MTLFWIASAIAALATARVITEKNPMRALLYLIVSFLAVAVLFFELGAPFAAALEVITYAGAIMVLIVFVIILLDVAPVQPSAPRATAPPGSRIVRMGFKNAIVHSPIRARGAYRSLLKRFLSAVVSPACLAAFLLAELVAAFLHAGWVGSGRAGVPIQGLIAVGPRSVGVALYGHYVLVVELASFLLLAGLIGACHLAYRKEAVRPELALEAAEGKPLPSTPGLAVRRAAAVEGQEAAESEPKARSRS